MGLPCFLGLLAFWSWLLIGIKCLMRLIDKFNFVQASLSLGAALLVGGVALFLLGGVLKLVFAILGIVVRCTFYVILGFLVLIVVMSLL